MNIRAALPFLAAAVFGLVALPSSGQSYSIDWYKVSGGGGTSTNGQYTVSGTIGQPDAGAMSGGNYSLTGGFWAVTAVVIPGAPLLTIRSTATNSVIISWPSASAGFLLQQSASVATPGWANFSGVTNDDGTNKSVTIHPPTGNLFFRLSSP